MAPTTRAQHSKLDPVAINQGLTVVYPDPDQSKKSPGDEITVDIVAVPGLGANPEWTWRSKNKVDWLRDSNMLPRAIKNARIMIFEYESQWFGKGSINQRLSTVADQLVLALFHQRPRGSKRPIVFVCHCLGGIVVEKALLAAQLRQNDYPNIFMSVVGCIFLGTPFRGTKSQGKASLLADMAETVGLGVNSGLLKLLEEGSEMLRDLLSDFSALAREANMQLFCFFEQHESDVASLAIKNSRLKHKELIVEEDSAHIDGYRTGALASDHFGLNKFYGPKDGQYQLVSSEINAAVQKAHGILKSRQNAMRQNLIDDATYQTIMDDLKATDTRKDLEDSLRGRPVSQASWALSNPEYIAWKTKADASVLWVHGNAGKGQPVIACAVIQDLQQQAGNQDGTFVAYFFCDGNDSHRRTIRDVLKHLIRQIIWKNRDLTEYLLVDEGKGKKGNRRSQNFDTIPLVELWRRLQSMISDTMVDKVYFVINAFDETDGESRREFLQLIEPIFKRKEAEKEPTADETTVKWVFLSRSGRVDIEKIFQNGLTICTEDKENADLVNNAVKREISAQVDGLSRQKTFNNALTYLIKRYLYQKAEGNYIYAQLVVQELKNLEPWQTNISAIRRLLEDFPYGLTDMFEFIRKRVLNPHSEAIEYTKEILRCLMIATESPTLIELALIADLPVEVRNDEPAIRAYVRRCGAFLINSTDDNGNEIIEWIDVAAKEHLSVYAKDELSLGLDDVQHGIIALRCLEHVRRFFAPKPAENEKIEGNIGGGSVIGDQPNENADVGSGYGEGQSEDENDNADPRSSEDLPLPGEDVREMAGDNPMEASKEQAAQQVNESTDEHQAEDPQGSQSDELFVDYAVAHWIDHAKLAPVDIVEEFDLSEDFWSEYSTSRALWWNEYSVDTAHAGINDLMPLHLAALSGYSALLNYLLDNGHAHELYKSDSWGYTPLAWACEYGDESAVHRLCKAGADVNQTGEPGGPSGLWAAALSGHLDIVQYLIEHGAQVNTPNEEKGTALYVATSGCSPGIVRELLRQGAEVNLKGGWHIRPINVAAYSGYTEITQILLEHGSKVDSEENYHYGSALGAAARRGHAEIIRILIQKGWSVNQKLTGYGSPLVAAATYGHEEAVQVLLDNRVDGASQIQALEVAAKNGRTEVVKYLLERTPHLPHQKAFHNAASYGRDDIVELLKGRGTSQEMLNDALYHASDQERESTISLLLRLGADPDAEGKEYGNALQAAAYDGSKGIVELLLSYKAHVNVQGGDHGTAIQAAALNGHVEIVQILLDHGAQVNTGTIGRYGSALQAACWSGDTDLVKLLITHGADVNSTGGIYGSPLMAAVDEGWDQIVEMVVESGGDVNVKDARDHKPTVLVQAGYVLGKESLELLLDHGANIEGTDDQGVTVLISVADSGDKESLAMLLERGANIHAVSESLGTALSAAASEGDEESCRVLLSHGAEVNQPSGGWGTALQAAADAADLDCINMLLEAGADINQAGGTLGCALQAAARSGDIECLERLLNAGADVNRTAGEYGCALHAAANAGNHECLQALLDHGADVNLEGGTYHSSLQAAAAAKENSIKCVETLLEQGANVFSCGGLYGSVIEAAATGKYADLFDILMDHDADPHAKGGKYGDALQAAALKSGQEFVQRLLEQGVEVNNVHGKYGTALQAAAFANNADVTNLLLEYSANPELEGGLYGNALGAAACRGSIDVLRLLLDQALPTEMIDEALIQAVYHRRESAVETLLQKGASVEANDGIIGSVFDALQKEAPEELNSDDEEDEEDEDEDEDDEGSSSGSDDEGDEADEGDDTNDASSQGGTNDQESVIDEPLEDPTGTQSRIQKLLEDARTNIRRNPSLRRPPTIKRKAVSGDARLVGHSPWSDPSPQQSYNGSPYQRLGNRWQGSQSQNLRPNPPSVSRPNEGTTDGGYPDHLQSMVPTPSQQFPGTEVMTDHKFRPYAPPQNQPYPPQAQNQHYTDAQPPPPSLPPKMNTYGQVPNIPYASHTSHQDPYVKTAPPPPKPPRPTTNLSNYRAYTPPSPQPPRRPQQPYQPQQSFVNSSDPPPPSNYAPYPASAASPPYAGSSSNANAPPFPPRPPPSTGQSGDSFDFQRLQEKANKFGASVGKFWR